MEFTNQSTDKQMLTNDYKWKETFIIRLEISI